MAGLQVLGRDHTACENGVMRTKLKAVLIGVATSLCLTGCASPVTYMVQYPYYESLQEIIEASDLIVTATMTSSRVQRFEEGSGEPMVYTVYSFRVSKCYQGCIERPEPWDIEVRQLGGVLRGVEHRMSDGDRFEKGEKYHLFLSEFPDFPYVVVNPIQGAYLGLPDHNDNYLSASLTSSWTISVAEFEELVGR